MNDFIPKTGTEADWNNAYYRLEDYFRAMRVTDRVHESRLIMRVLQTAADRHAEDLAQNPTVLAMEEARSWVSRWFEAVMGPRERMEATGLLCMLAIDAPSRWPTAFLADEIPVEFQNEMRESHVKAGPDLQVSSMVPRPIDVTPLLETLHLSGAMDKMRWVVAFVAALVLAVLTFSVFAFVR